MTLSVLVASAGSLANEPLDKFISFDDPYYCNPGKDLDALLRGLLRWEADGESYKGTLTIPPVPRAFRKQVQNPSLAVEGNRYLVTVPLKGTWQGLPLRSLLVVQWVESEGGLFLLFDAPVEAVRNAANRAGFRIPLTDSEYRDEGVMGVTVGIEDHDGTGALYCVDG